MSGSRINTGASSSRALDERGENSPVDGLRTNSFDSNSGSSDRRTAGTQPPAPRKTTGLGRQLAEAFRHGFVKRPVTLHLNAGPQEPFSKILTGEARVSNQDWTSVAPKLSLLTSFRAGAVDAQAIKGKYKAAQETRAARGHQGYAPGGDALSCHKKTLEDEVKKLRKLVNAAGAVKAEIRSLAPDQKMAALKDLSAVMAEVGGETASSNAGYEVQKHLFRAVRHELTAERSGMNGAFDKLRGLLSKPRNSAHVVQNPNSADLRDVLVNLAECRKNVHLPNERTTSTGVPMAQPESKRDLENKLDQFINSQLPRLTPADQTTVQNART